MKTKVRFIGKIVDGQVTFVASEDSQYLNDFNGKVVNVTVALPKNVADTLHEIEVEDSADIALKDACLAWSGVGVCNLRRGHDRGPDANPLHSWQRWGTKAGA